MNMHGFCNDCHQIKRVQVQSYATRPNGAQIPVGTCGDCLAKVDSRRQEAGELTVFVPADPDDIFRIVKGSGIVGRDTGGDRITVYFEGDVYGSGMDFNEKLLHAADRLVARYPTVAFASLPREQLVPVGTFDYGTFTADITNEAALAAWRDAA